MSSNRFLVIQIFFIFLFSVFVGRCLSFYHFSVRHCIIRSSLIYHPFWYLLLFYRSLFVLLSFFCSPLYYSVLFDLPPLLVSSFVLQIAVCPFIIFLFAIVLFGPLRFTTPFGIFFCFVDRCLFVCSFSLGHYIACPSSIYNFWLPLWYRQTLFLQIIINIRSSFFFEFSEWELNMCPLWSVAILM